MRFIMLILVFAIPLCSGCGVKSKRAEEKEEHSAAFAPPDAAQDLGGRKAADKAAAGGAQDVKPKAQKPRKIRTTADMHLIVQDFAEAVKELKAAMKQYDSEEENAEINASANRVRSGTWKIRVPIARFDEFREAVARIGDVEKHTVNSEDMSEKYYDLQADIENLMAGRETLRELLKETGKKEMKHYLEVWEKLEGLSGEINRKEGTLKLWENQTERTTCTVNMREKQPYNPAPPVESKEVPSFSQRSGRTWEDTWGAFVGFWQWLVLFAIALAPWLPICLVGAVCLWRVTRRSRREANPPPIIELVADPNIEKEQ